MADYWSRFTSRRVSRRRTLAAGATTAAAAAFLAACGGDDDGGAAGGTGPAAATGATGTTGGPAASAGGEAVVDRMVYGHTFSGTESNDTRDLTGAESWQLRPVYESLLSHDRENGAIIAGLAEAWEPSPDGTSITFKLRKGVPFHDGWGEMTAEDAAFTFEYAVADPERGDSLRGFIDSVEAIGADEMVLRLRQPDNAAITWFMTDMFIWGGIISRAHWDDMGDPSGITTPPVAGTGPWRYLEREAGSFLRFARVDDHWRHTSDFKELEIRIQNETSTKLASFLAEETHLTTLPVDLQQQALDRGMEFTTGNVPSARVWLDMIGSGLRFVDSGQLRFPDSPLTDDRVRKALNKAVDRNALNQAFLDGRGELMMIGTHHPTRPGWDEGWLARFEDEYGFDQDAARDLLSAAGYGDNNKLQTHMLANTSYESPAPFGTDMQEVIMDYWRQVGVESDLITIDRATMTDMRNNFEFDNHHFFVWTASDMNIGLRVWMLNNLRATEPDYTGSESGWTTPGLDQKFDEMLSQLQDEPYAALAKEIGEELFANHSHLPLFWLPTDIVFNPKVVTGWSMPGNYGGFLSHLEYVEAVKK
jgi:ABC-type transport system substrate-binding protein